MTEHLIYPYNGGMNTCLMAVCIKWSCYCFYWSTESNTSTAEEHDTESDVNCDNPRSRF